MRNLLSIAILILICVVPRTVKGQSNTNPPMILMPLDGMEIQAGVRPQFRWTPPMPIGEEPPFYTVYVFEILEGQTAATALRANQPIIEAFNLETSFLSWPENVPLPEENTCYTWFVESYDFLSGEQLISIPGIFCTPKDTASGCLPPQLTPEKGPPISLGMHVDSPSVFPYPRALPMRAEGIDWDIVKYECKGCGENTSTYDMPVRDEVQQFVWKIINGEGSLESPYKANDIAGTENSIDSLLAVIARLESRLAEIPAELDSIPVEKRRLDDKITVIERTITKKTRQIDSLITIRDSVLQAITDIQTQIDVHRTEITTKQGQIKSKQSEIDSLQAKLDGKPGKAEQSKINDVRTKRQDVELAREAVVQKEEQIRQRATALEVAIKTAQTQLDNAASSYNQTQQQITAKTTQIRQLENRLYADSRLYDYFQWKQDYTNKIIAFLVANGGNSTLSNRLTTVNNAALNVLQQSGQGARQTAYNTFESELTSMRSGLTAMCNGNTTCTAQLQQISSSENQYKAAVQVFISSALRIDQTILNSINTLRGEVKALQNTLTAQNNTVKSASTSYQNAVRAHRTEIDQLEREKRNLIQTLENKRSTLTKAEGELQNMVKAREDSTRMNKGTYLETIRNRSQEILDNTIRINDLSDSITIKRTRLDGLRVRLSEINEQIRTAEQERSIAEGIRDGLKAQKDELDNKKRRLEAEQKRLQDDLNAAKARLAALRKKLEALKSPSREAMGPYVYYIPPPLENIMNRGEFERLRKKVNDAEDSLKIAYEAKAKLQVKLSKELVTIGNALVDYQQNKLRSASYDEDIKKTRNEVDSAKTAQSLSENQRKDDLTDQAKKQENKLKIAEDSLSRAIADSTGIQGELKSHRKLVEKNDTLLKEEYDKLLDLEKQWKDAEKIWHQVSDERIALDAQIRQKEGEVATAEREKSRAQNDLNRARALEDAGGQISASNAVKAAQTKIDNLNNELSTLRTNRASKSADEDKKLTETQTAHGAYETHKEGYELKRDIQVRYIKKLFELNRSYERALSGISHYRRLKADEEAKNKKLQDAVKNANVDSLVNNSDGVKEKADKLAELEASKKKADDAVKSAERKISDAKLRKDQLTSAVERRLQNAKDSLKKAEEDLQKFLRDEFKNPKINVTLKLTAVDKGSKLDDWRTKDGPSEQTTTLTYKGRIPNFKDIPLKEEKPDNKEEFICLPFIEFDKVNPPDPKGVGIAKQEPRTIALAYKKGEPLWKEWPVIPQDNKDLLAKDVVVVNGNVENDKDEIRYTCKPMSDEEGETGEDAILMPGGNAIPVESGNSSTTGNQPSDNTTRERGTGETKERGNTGESTTKDGGETTDGGDGEETPGEDGCAWVAPVADEIIDLGTYQWSAGRMVGPGGERSHNQALWETPIIPRPKIQDPKDVFLIYTASELAEDEPKNKKGTFTVKPGVLIEVPDSLLGVSDTAYDFSARVVTGDHKGLAGETIEFSVELTEGESQQFGFERVTTKTATTNSDGYAQVKFNFGNGYGKFLIKVKWLRNNQVVQDDSCVAKTPIRLQFIQFANGPADFAWKAAMEVFKGGAVNDKLFTDNKFPDKLAKEGEDDPWSKVSAFVAGIQDEEREAINDLELEFRKKKGKGSISPEKEKTQLIGIARSLASDVPEDGEITVESEVEAKYRPLSDPKKVEGDFSSSKTKSFKIGLSSALFVIEAEEEFDPAEPFTGSGKLNLQLQDGVLYPLKDVKLSINEVVLEQKGDDDFLAVEGSVSWKSDKELKKTYLGFEFTLDSLSIYAHQGAGVAGKVKPPKYEKAVSFEAIANPDGNFLGTVSDLPSVEIGGLKLKEGASLTLDMHTAQNPPGSNLRFDFMGIYIPSATIELPESFQKKSATKPTTLHAKDFSIGRGGVSGSIALTGDFIDMAYGGYEFKADSIAIEIEENSLKSGVFKGALKPGASMEGDIGILISATGAAFTASITTGSPVYMRRLATTFKLNDGTGLVYDREKKIGTLTINANISSSKYGNMAIEGFELKSDGSIKADRLKVDKAIKFGKGFDLYVEHLSFKRTPTEFSMGFKGSLGFYSMGSISADVSIQPGPVVEFAEVAVKFEKNPVDFSGTLKYKADVFEGEFALGIKMGSGATRGIGGTLIIGTQIDQPDTFTYWYVEINYSGPPLPIAQTGLGFTKFGGGVGYHYNPPLGTSPGSPSKETTFGLKAITGVGNILPTPGGLFNSELQMVLVPGKFSMYGKVWLLTKEESLFGEGQLNLAWVPKGQLDGYVRMFVGIPNKDGDVFKFNGQLNYSFPANNKRQYIWSENISGSFLNKVNAEAVIVIAQDRTSMDGTLTYELEKSVGIGSLELSADIDVKATGSFLYTNASQRLNASATFNGTWDVDLKTPLGNADIITGDVALALELKASPSQVEVKGSANVSWNVWRFSDSYDLDVGYIASIN
ncbi:MAG: hypothetical protein H6608_12705 [Flavobacteriales bacterium]|nr:hypothetical protein [Flavobacteriales bacterium]